MMNVVDIDKMLETAEAPVIGECCIYRVPFPIRRHNQDAYTPNVVSIGPFHHNSDSRLFNMERHKLNYCKAFLQRTQTASDTWKRYIEEVEPQFRRFYSDTLNISTEELVKIIFVDSGFILELFCRYHEGWSNDDVCLSTNWLRCYIRIDLLLLENQLPFSLLQTLYSMSFTSTSTRSLIEPFTSTSTRSLIERTFHYFSNYNKSKVSINDNISIRHFTDLIRIFHLQHPKERRPLRSGNQLLTHLPSTTQLLEAGVRFKVKTESDCLLNLTFSRGILRIPQLIVEDDTKILFHNMVALEQCHYPHESYITDYVDIMDFLINTKEDVDKLVQKKVLINCLEDVDSVANMFNGLCKDVTIIDRNCNYNQIFEKLNGFYGNRYNIWKATLRREYCKTPWKIAISVAGIILLFLAVVQTVCAVLEVTQQ
ncbi:UPF0481 protein At3g47200 isoform X2 [Cajanus cajan]|nr:UPF0481 protein At3g47200 isoform X2 [Cajanus cajan]XP_020207179.1 UPF0481 protein At3g47200 isoform X2 [Cajanus cajan]